MDQSLKQDILEVQYSFTVGNITGDGVTLVDEGYNVIQLPKSLLPMGTVSGSAICMTLRRDIETQQNQSQKISKLIDKLQTGESVGDSIIQSEDYSENSSRQNLHNKKLTKTATKPQPKSITRMAQQVKLQQKLQKPQSGMKKKPKLQKAPQEKPISISNLQQIKQQRQKSIGRRASSAMKKIKPSQN